MKGKSIRETETAHSNLQRQVMSKLYWCRFIVVGWGNVSGARFCCASRAVPHQHASSIDVEHWRHKMHAVHAFELQIQNALDSIFIWRFRRIEPFSQSMRSSTRQLTQPFRYFVILSLIRCCIMYDFIILLEHRIRARSTLATLALNIYGNEM